MKQNASPKPAAAAATCFGVYSPPPGDSKLAAVLTAAAAVALGRAVQLGDGMFVPAAIPYLAAAQLATLAALVAPARAGLERVASALTLPLGLSALGWQVAQLLTQAAPAKYLVLPTQQDSQGFFVGVATVAVGGAGLAGLAAGGLRRPASLLLPGLGWLAAFAAWGAWLVAHSPDPDMDVVMFHRQAVPTLLAGHNPYAMQFDFPRGNPAGYPPGMAAGGKLLFGYPYMPLGLLLSVPGHLAGDYRYSLLAALLVAAACMGALGWRRHGPLAAALLLTTPRVLYHLELGWTEPYCLALVGGVLAAARWRPRWLPAAVGLLAASKQYVPVVVPALMLLPPLRAGDRAGRAAWWRAGCWAAAVTGPFVLVGPAAFVRDVVQVQLTTPVRHDALNYSAWLHATWGLTLPAPLGAALAALALGLCGWRAPRTPMGAALALGFVLQAFLAINRQAFANYYLLVQGCYLFALATCSPTTAPSVPPRAAPPPAAEPARTPARPAAARARPRRR